MNRPLTAQATTITESAQYFAFSRTPGAIAELDGLRAIAVLLVLGRHAVWPLYEQSRQLFPIGSWDLAVPFVNGWIGVDLFFVLSGFLITHHILRRGGDQPLAKLGRYLSARALRIIPAYVAVLALVVAGAIPFYEVAPEHLTLRIAYHLVFLQDYLPANILVPFWSLGVEEKFYLIAPLLVSAALVCRSRGSRYVFLAALVLLPVFLRAAAAFLHPEITEYSSFFRVFRSPFHVSFDGLAIGVCCAFFFRDRANMKWSEQVCWPVCLFWISTAMLISQLFVSELLSQIGWYQKVLQPFVISLTFGGLLLSVACGGANGGLLRSHGLLVVARVSYPLYLIHLAFVPLALALTGFVVGADLLDFLGYFAVFVGVSMLAAFALHFAVEKPFLLLKDHLWKAPLKTISVN